MINVVNVSHRYKNGDGNEVLHDLSFSIEDGKFVVLLGQSGSGKTTLLNIVAGLMKPSKGKVLFDGNDIYTLKPDELCKFRASNIGFVFQNYFLEKSFTAGENVLIPLLLRDDLNKEERCKKVSEVLDKVGIGEKKDMRVSELSGGECQRVSIARAVVNEPGILIADEPTGNLDSKNGDLVIKMLKSLTEEGTTVLMVTHNENYAEYADLVLRICDGNII